MLAGEEARLKSPPITLPERFNSQVVVFGVGRHGKMALAYGTLHENTPSDAPAVKFSLTI